MNINEIEEKLRKLKLEMYDAVNTLLDIQKKEEQSKPLHKYSFLRNRLLDESITLLAKVISNINELQE